MIIALSPAASQAVLAAIVTGPAAAVWTVRRWLIARSLHEDPDPGEFLELLRTVDEDDMFLAAGEDSIAS